MKKFMALALALTLVLSLSACGKGGDGTASDNTNETVTLSNCEVTLLGCTFNKSVTAQDKEFIGSAFTERDGKVYVDLVLKVKNTGTSNITDDDITGYFMYQDLRYDMQLAIEAGSLTALDYDRDGIPPQTTAFVHLFRLVDKAATAETLTVNYKIYEKEYTAAVAQEDTRDALAKKTKVSVGDKVNNGLYSFEVIEISAKQYLQATNLEESQQYQPFGKGQFVHMLLKVKNNTETPLTGITAYTIVDGTTFRGEGKKETTNHTKLEGLSDSPLASGEEEYCHLYAIVNEDIDTTGLLLRFNLGGICYYGELK